MAFMEGHSIGRIEEPAVRVLKACKSYGSKREPHVVLDSLNMTVPKGCIYGLLGASGCGKTTLLSCIVGRRRIQSGDIWVLGGPPGSKESGVPGARVGYMPQEIALYGEFTIYETMRYFGWIAGMSTKEIDPRADFLINLLKLPDRNKAVKHLSGGQQRRVSIASTFIHNAELLILDEPTVGLDPVLRESIWEYMVEMTTVEKKTIIITTHYIEETKQAHLIGMMRKGKLLIEQSPSKLLESFEVDSLEEIFLKLSSEQNMNRALSNANIIESTGAVASQPAFNEFNFKEHLIKDVSSLMKPHHMKALLWKHMSYMWRNLGMLLYIFILPLIEVILFCLCVGTEPVGLPIAIMNREFPSAQPCDYNSSCALDMLSCRFLDHFSRRKHNLIPYFDNEKAVEAVKRGHAYAFIEIPPEFSKNLGERFELGFGTNDSTLLASEISVRVDMSNQQIALIINRDILYSLQDFAEDISAACSLPSATLKTPITFEKPVYGNSSPKYTNFVAPGIFLLIAFFLSVAATSGCMIFERNEGILERSLVSGINALEIMVAFAVTQVIILICVAIMMVIVGFYIFHLENYGSIVLVFLLTVWSGICGMSYGFVVSCVCEIERTSMFVAMGSLLPFMELCGILWPMEGMHEALRPISNFLPMTLPTDSMRAIMARGWNLTERTVYMGFVSNFIWSGIFLSISALVLKFKKG